MKKLISSLLLAVSLFTAGSAVGAHGEEVHSKGDVNAFNKELSKVRQATAKYHDVQQAFEDGYINTLEFAYVPELGGMGIHFVNPGLMGDEDIIPTQPEVLLYAPTKNGGYKLIGVEYYVPANLATKHPTLFDQIQFDGPMLNHELESIADSLTDEEKNNPENQHYDLHVWIWQSNPSGIFAPFNPNIKPIE